MVRIHDLSTDEIIDREMNDEEFEAFQAQQISNAKEEAALAQKAAEKASLLKRLGLTEDELKTILG
jgi:predicted DNA binding CopG/RHH family protein